MRMLRACLVGSVVLLGACAGGSDGSSIQSSASGETPSDMPMNDAETRDQWLDINGVRVRYTVDGEGPVIILLHGYMVDAEMNWRSRGIIDSLAVDFTVIAPDLRGHGFSDKPHDPSAYGLQFVEDVIALMDHRHIEQAHVVGYSMGGEITAKLLEQYPNRLRSVVIGGAGLLREAGPSLESYDYWATALAGLTPGQGIVDALGELPPGLSERDLEVIDRNDAVAISAVARQTAVLRVPDEAFRANRVPTLVVMGELDEYKADIDALVAHGASTQVRELPGLNHVGAIGSPLFVDAIRTFVISQPS